VQIDVLRPRAGPVASRVTLAGHRLIGAVENGELAWLLAEGPRCRAIDRKSFTAIW